ncbi:MAG: hypothetical protein KQI62_19570, partial [Deltaproteobacteria bacterium]|nr:hypothetical protein [Deltaproteobacteria bacterium]
MRLLAWVMWLQVGNGGESWVSPSKGAKVFTGWSAHNIDAKGRVAVPARFRDVLKQKHGDERVVVTTSDRCLVAYPYEEWRAIADKI